MSTPTIIIDGKDPSAKRLSISIDQALWALYVASCGGSVKSARLQLKERMKLGKIKNTYDAKCWVYTEIAQPTLLSQLENKNRLEFDCTD